VEQIRITNKSGSVITLIEDDSAPYGLLPNKQVTTKAEKITVIVQIAPCSIELECQKVPGPP